jgi:two-component sensor histidine kinase
VHCNNILITIITISILLLSNQNKVYAHGQNDLSNDSIYIKELKNIYGKGSKNKLAALNQLDSLLAIPDVINHPNVLVKGFRIKSKYLIDIKKDSALWYIRESVKIAADNNIKSEWFKSMKVYALRSKSLKQYDLSDSLYNVLFNDEYVNENETKKVILYADYASLKFNQSKSQEAIDALDNAIDIAVRNDYHKDDKFLYNRLSFLFFQLKEYKKSIRYNHKTIDLLRNHDAEYKSSYLNSIAASYLMLNEIDSAKLYLNKTIESNPSSIIRMFSYQYLSDIAVQEHEYNTALRYANLCVALANELNESTCECELRQAISYNRLGQYSRSQSIINKIKSCTSQHITKGIHNSLRIFELDNALRLMDREDLATSIDTIISERDSLNISKSKTQLLEIETKYEAQKKETENQLLKKDNEIASAKIAQQRTLLGGTAITILSLGILMISLVNRNRERKKSIESLNQKNTAIQALNQEITHRTKNHLALATALLSNDKRQSDNPKVRSILNENENRLRTLALVNKKLNQVSLQDKLNLKDYLQELCDDLIFSLRNDRNASIQLHCPELELDSEKTLRLGLITNELITNSIKHAKTENDHLSLQLRIEAKNNNELSYSYRDNGVKKDEDPISNSNSQGINLIESLWTQMNGTYTQSMVPYYKMVGSIVL